MFEFLGQVGFLFEGEAKFLIDPYLSHSVELKEDPSFRRKVPIKYSPGLLTDIDFVLITHAHRDHCDVDTLLPLSKASPRCHFYGPAPVEALLLAAGLDKKRVHRVEDRPISIADVNISVLPSAHPEIKRDKRGGWQAVGYVFTFHDKVFYHPGDTAVTKGVLEAVQVFDNIDIGLIPVNEINYYRDAENIIGNMSVREAFQFSQDLGIKKVIPTHWDMFEKNQVYKEEIQLLYNKIKPNFDLEILDAGTSYVS